VKSRRPAAEFYDPLARHVVRRYAAGQVTEPGRALDGDFTLWVRLPQLRDRIRMVSTDLTSF